jgi:hypothetical protein
VITLLIELWMRRRRGPGPFALAALPAAVLFLVFPVAPLLFETTRTFQQVGSSGLNGTATVADVMLRIQRVLFAGSIAAIVTLAVASLLELRGASAAGDEPAAAADAAPDARSTLSKWGLIVCSLLVVPGAVLLYVAEDVPRLTTVAMEVTTGRVSSPPELAGFSQRIASRIVTGVWLGLVLSVGAVLAAIASLFAAAFLQPPDRLRSYSRIVAAVVMLGALGNAVRLNGQIEWTTRVAADAAGHAPAAPGGDDPPPSAPAESAVRFDGVYRTEKPIEGAYRYWSFQPGGQCSPYSASSDGAPPPPPAPGRHWTCDIRGDAITVVYSENDAVVKTAKGIRRDRETLVIDRLTYHFIDGSRLR